MNQDEVARPLWRCEFHRLEDGPALGELTVGAKFLLKCSGLSIEPWKEIPQLKFATPEDQFSLTILEMKKADSNSAEFVVTGYKPGQYSGLVAIGSGENEVQVQDLKWGFQSVIEAEQGQPVEPFGAFGPQNIQWPWWLWVSIGLSIVSIGTLIWWQVRRYRARQRLIEKIKSTASVLSPYAQLHKDLRALLRRYEGKSKADEKNRPEEYAHLLNESFRQYLSRELLVPATEWSIEAVLRDIKKRHRRLYRETGTEIYGVLRELNKATRAKAVNFTDCNQLHEMSRRTAEKIERTKGVRV